MSATNASQTAAHLTAAIEASGRSHAEIAKDIGMKYPNVISMWATGVTQVPFETIPRLARALGTDPSAFLDIAMGEYHPALANALIEAGHLTYEPYERKLLEVCRRVTEGREMPWSDELECALYGLFELAMADVPD